MCTVPKCDIRACTLAPRPHTRTQYTSIYRGTHIVHADVRTQAQAPPHASLMLAPPWAVTRRLVIHLSYTMRRRAERSALGGPSTALSHSRGKINSEHGMAWRRHSFRWPPVRTCACLWGRKLSRQAGRRAGKHGRRASDRMHTGENESPARGARTLRRGRLERRSNSRLPPRDCMYIYIRMYVCTTATAQR